MSERYVVIELDQFGERLDTALARAMPELSRSQCQRLIRDGQVTVAGQPVRSSYRLQGKERVQVTIPEVADTDLVAEPIPLDIRYEDGDIIVVNKPAGMVVHPAAGHDRGTLVNAVLAHYPDLAGIGGERRPGIVHRLDKDTSGLIVVAKNERALRHLQRQFKRRTVAKVYLALVEGSFRPPEALIDASIGRDPRDRKRMAVIPPESSARSRAAQTVVKVLQSFVDYSLVECRPHTGRTHQIRVHLAFAGFPIVGDALYGRRKQKLPLNRLFLHASALSFKPLSGDQVLTIHSELPQELSSALAKLAG